jgi:hypothetical protein
MMNRLLPVWLSFSLLCQAKDICSWQAVEQLAAGTVLKINPPQRLYCRVIHVSHEALECALLLASGERLSVFQPGQVQQIRLAIPKKSQQRRNTLLGAVAGEALGMVWAHATAASGFGSDPLTAAIAATPVAGVVGAFAHTFSSGERFRDGPVVYRTWQDRNCYADGNH